MNIKNNIVFILLSAFLLGCGGIKHDNNTQKIVISTSTSSVPLYCKDPTNIYKFVSTINSRTNYLEENYAYQPIQYSRGIIIHDFNKDKKLDLIFLERRIVQSKKYNRKNPDIRLVVCESHKNGYKRRYPAFPIFENMAHDFQAGSQRIELHGELLMLKRNNHEHNWGSDSEISAYRYNTALKDFGLLKREVVSSSGDGYRSDTDESYDLKTLRYTRHTSCGPYEEGCKSGTIFGRIVPLKIKPSLYKEKQGKFYAQLIQDKK